LLANQLRVNLVAELFFVVGVAADLEADCGVDALMGGFGLFEVKGQVPK
jgi:hypothetical protein